MLLSPLKNIVSAGFLPHIVTGNVPISLSSSPKLGGFGFNVAPPRNLSEYRSYIAGVASALVREFGQSEVARWRRNQGCCYGWCPSGRRPVQSAQASPGKSSKRPCNSWPCDRPARSTSGNCREYEGRAERCASFDGGQGGQEGLGRSGEIEGGQGRSREIIKGRSMRSVEVSGGQTRSREVKGDQV